MLKIKELDDFIGQKEIIKWFKSCIQRDALPQVILLRGKPGIGKTSIAKVVASEIACMETPDKLAETKRVVIDESKSNDCVRIYNMSNLKSQEAVANVKSELSIGFSTTGRKVVIMDEAHGMSDDAQDSLLTTFENLQSKVYIIICTTELDCFRDAFLSRCIIRNLSNLSRSEMNTLLKREIAARKLNFSIPINMVHSLINNYTGREPRRAINLLDSFEVGSTVGTNELNTFFNVFEGKEVLTLIGYLYAGDILRGLSFIADMSVGESYKATVIELLQVANNGQTYILDSDSVLHLRMLYNNNPDLLLGFTIDCTTKGRLTRNDLSGLFLKWCSSASNLVVDTPVRKHEDAVRVDDIRHMSDIIKTHNDTVSNTNSIPLTLAELMDSGEVVE